MNDRTSGAKEAVKNMLFYYISALIDNGCNNPKSVIANEIIDMLELTEDQALYINSKLSDSNKLSDNLSMSIDLLTKIEENKVMDFESITIIKKVLKLMLENLSEANERYKEDNAK